MQASLHWCRKCGSAFLDAIFTRLCGICRLERKRMASDSTDA